MVPNDHPVALHAGVKATNLREAFEREGWVQISPFLTDASAKLLREHVEQRDDWTVSVHMDKHGEFDRERWAALSPHQREAIQRLVAPSEETGFRYLFEQIVVVGNDLKECEPSSLLGQFASFLSSEPFLGLVREITGSEDVRFADARATRYSAGHFLSTHDDEVAGLSRRFAYTFGLTPAWRPEWGGLLMFHSSDGDVEHALVPRMNALNLFQVPRRHSVSLVAPFAPVPRYSITGWVRASAETD